MTEPVTYPKRPSHFAHKFCRLLAKATIANELGADVCWLLTVIAHTEDAKGYRGAVLYHNGQLMSFCGFKSEDKLARCRKRAVDAGWLHYIAGARGVAARYWVIVPGDHLGKDDLPSDERPDKYELAQPAKAESQHPAGAGESAVDVRGKAAGPTQSESQHPPVAEESAEKVRSICGRSAGESAVDVRDSSSLHLNLHLDQDERQAPPAEEPTEPFDPLRADEANRKLFERRWNASGLRPLKRLSHHLHSRLKALLCDAQWAADYPAALERAGKIPWLRDGTGRKRGAYDVSEFLRDDDEVRKLLAGVYDPHAPPARGDPKTDYATRTALDAMGLPDG